MFLNNLLHVVHATIANLDIVLIEYFMESVRSWEMFSHQFKKDFPNIRFDTLIVRRIEPYDVTFSCFTSIVGVFFIDK